MSEGLRTLLFYFFTLLQFAIFARVIVSWIAPMSGTTNPLINFIYQVTEPIMAPLRRIIPRVGMFDFTPMIALIVLWAILAFLRQS